MNYIKISFVLILSVFITRGIYSQQPTGSVCISEDDLAPHNSAILHVSSNKKGVLFPRMTFEAATNIENKHNGLIVFITDSLKMGYWYWNASEAKWTQVRDEDTGDQDVEAPYGGIIMYSGKVNSSLFNAEGCGYKGTKVQGWHICNGQGGTPNLSGKFIMGSSTLAGGTGGSDKIVLETSNMPVHTHETNPVNGTIEAHDHAISEVPHHHEIDITWKKIDGRKRSRHVEVRKEGTDHVDNLPESYDAGPNGNIQMEDASGRITFSTSDLNSKITVEEAGGGKPIENRPSFYVVLYLMRINPEGCESL